MARINCCAAPFALVLCLSAVLAARVSGVHPTEDPVMKIFHDNRVVNCERDSTKWKVDSVFGVLLQCFVRCKGTFSWGYERDGAPCNTTTMERGACHSGVCKKVTTTSAILPTTTEQPERETTAFIRAKDPATTVVQHSNPLGTEAAVPTTERPQTPVTGTNWATTAVYTPHINEPLPSLEPKLQTNVPAASVAQRSTWSVLTSQRFVFRKETTTHQMTRAESKPPSSVTQTADSVAAEVGATRSERVPATFHFDLISGAPAERQFPTSVVVDAVTGWPYIIITDFAYKFAQPARLRAAASTPFPEEAL